MITFNLLLLVTSFFLLICRIVYSVILLWRNSNKMKLLIQEEVIDIT